ncbi:PAS domain S-box protein [Methylomonas sp. SURF-2]|uniref:histidine kinase n=1 Tax=Methylomonas subterranea TaxID=2952225 RepID=A0ABT1TJR3_9GAMM|nr:PAS domain S-box protein [Methylomonas sp. SURF-2]MCQ8105710.1 PAS domain S-box protein [Methylomonas sp. SURF-2]
MNIHKRLSLVLWGSALLAFMVAAATFLLVDRLTLDTRVRQIMEPYAQLVSVGTDAAVAFEDPHRAQEILDTLRVNPYIREAEIYLSNGRMLASINAQTDSRPAPTPAKPNGIKISIGSDKAELLQDLPSGGYLHLIMSLEQLSQQTHQALWIFGAGVMVLLFATLGQLLVLRRTIVTPIASLTTATERARAAADYEQRVPVTGHDEVALLGRNFNAMMQAIQDREEALRRLTVFQRTILDHAAHAIISTAPDGIVTSFNPAAERLLGYAAREVVGVRSPALWHDQQEINQYAVGLSAELGTCISPGFEVFTARPLRNLPEQSEWTFIRRDGARIPVSLSVTALRDETGHVSGFLGLAYDLSERKQTENQLRLLGFALDRVKETIVLMGDNDPHFLYVNQSTALTLGYSREELTGGMSVYDIDPAWSPDVWREFWPELASRRQIQFETVHRTRNGRTFPVEVTGNYFEYAGKIYNLAICRDITERKKTEKALLEYVAIVESTDDAIIGKTLDGMITSWNKGAERMLGYPADEIIGKSISTLFAEEQNSEEQEIMQKIRNGERVSHYETVRRRKDGSLIDVSITVSPLRNSQGEIVGAAKIARDITERKRAEEDLRRYRDQLEETVQQRTAELLLTRDAAEAANKAKSAFLANMSHELRTPLNAILGFSALMRKNPALAESDRNNIDIINRSGEHLLSLINEVLEMAKIEAGRLQLEEAAFDLGAMVRDVTDMMQVRAREKNLRLAIDQSSDFPRFIVGDEARLRQILINLVGNALKFTQQGGVTIRLGTKNNAVAHLLIEVQDTGPGIAPEDQARIFEPFVQLGKTADNKGTGLGLSITRQFVQLMKGKMSLESSPGHGALFRVDLPLGHADAQDIHQLQHLEARDVVALAPGQADFRILVVEDQLDNQLLLVKLLERVGFQVKSAENGRRAVDIFQAWQPHFIWMDRQMPVMDGLEASRIIRRQPGGDKVKIVAVTASAFAEQRSEMLAAGMDDFIRKPYHAYEIYECLSRQLGVKFLTSETSALAMPDRVSNLESVSALPEHLRRDLENALVSLESERIDLIVNRIAECDRELAAELNQLVYNYAYPAILKALRSGQDEHDK